MMIRPFNAQDDVTKLIDDFILHDRCLISGDFVGQMINKCSENGIALVISNEGNIVGGICGIFAKTLTANEDAFQSIFFYVMNDFRFLSRELLSLAEQVCRDKGIKKMILASMGDNKRLDRFYELYDYKLLEKHFIKELIL